MKKIKIEDIGKYKNHLIYLAGNDKRLVCPVIISIEKVEISERRHRTVCNMYGRRIYMTHNKDTQIRTAGWTLTESNFEDIYVISEEEMIAILL